MTSKSTLFLPQEKKKQQSIVNLAHSVKYTMKKKLYYLQTYYDNNVIRKQKLGKKNNY